MDLIKKYFGEQLKNIRNMKNLTQEKLAEGAGINQRQLARIEAGESFVKSQTLGRICTYLDIEPKELFNFTYQKEFLKTGTDDDVHFSVIRSGNIYQIVNKTFSKSSSETEKTKENIDEKMIKLAQKVKRDIIVDEITDGEVIGTKIYKPNGQTEIKYIKQNDLFEKLQEKLSEIKNDKNKLEFLKLALDSFDDKNALENLKMMIKGLELSLKI